VSTVTTCKNRFSFSSFFRFSFIFFLRLLFFPDCLGKWKLALIKLTSSLSNNIDEKIRIKEFFQRTFAFKSQHEEKKTHCGKLQRVFHIAPLGFLRFFLSTVRAEKSEKSFSLRVMFEESVL